jgi:hypothetical protein
MRLYIMLVKFHALDIGRYLARNLAKEPDGRPREFYIMLCH